jgi:hypothetical protein
MRKRNAKLKKKLKRYSIRSRFNSKNYKKFSGKAKNLEKKLRKKNNLKRPRFRKKLEINKI